LPANACGVGGNWREDIVDVDVTVDHTAGSLAVVISSTLNQPANDESWGVRNILIYTLDLPNAQDVGSNDPGIFYKAFQGNQFTDTDGWSVVRPYSTNYFGGCANTRLLGGYGVLGAGSSLVK